jgi:hypothetical protein
LEFPKPPLLAILLLLVLNEFSGEYEFLGEIPVFE